MFSRRNFIKKTFFNQTHLEMSKFRFPPELSTVCSCLDYRFSFRYNAHISIALCSILINFNYLLESIE